MPPEINITSQTSRPAALPQPQPQSPASDPAAPSPAEIQAGIQQVVDKLFGPSEPVALSTKPEPPVAPPPDPDPGPEPPKPPATPEPAPASEPSDIESTIARTARATADAVADRLQPRVEPQQPQASGFELSKDDADDLRVLRYMARENPDKFGDLPEQFMAFCKKAYEYQDKWQSENADSEFKIGRAHV